MITGIRDAYGNLFGGELQVGYSFAMQQDATGLSLMEMVTEITEFGVVNIRHPRWAGGATGDGSGVRDQLAYDAAYAYLTDAFGPGAGVIKIPPGLYIMACYINHSNVVVVGAGSANTYVKAPATSQRKVFDAQTTAGSPFVSSATGNFTNADVGKNTLVWFQSYTGSYADFYSWAPHIKAVVSSTVVEMHEPAPPGTTYPAAITMVIGAPFNMMEVNPVWMGNSAPPLINVACGGITFDGNKDNVPIVNIPGVGNVDITGHNIILTNASYFYGYDLVSINAHNAGLAQVINSNYANISGLTVEECGNFDSIPAVDINSSKYSQWTNFIIRKGGPGMRVIDFCWGNVLNNLITQQTGGRGLICGGSNGPSKQNRISANISESGQEGAQISTRWDDNWFDLNVQWAGGKLVGHTFVPDTPGALTAGVLFGHPGISDAYAPKGNRANIKASFNCGAGLELASDFNTVHFTGNNNSQGAALGTYSLIITGRDNTVYSSQRDEQFDVDGIGQQRGTVVRRPDPLITDPLNEPGGTGNTVIIESSGPVSLFDDQSPEQNNKVYRCMNGVRQITATSGPVFLVAGVDVDTQVIANNLTNTMSVNVTGGIKSDRFQIIRRGLGLYPLFITDETGTIVFTIPEYCTGSCEMTNTGSNHWEVTDSYIQRYDESVTVVTTPTFGPVLWSPFNSNRYVIITVTLTGDMSFKPTLVGRKGMTLSVRRAGGGLFNMIFQDETSTTVAILDSPGVVDYVADDTGHWRFLRRTVDAPSTTPTFAASTTTSPSAVVPAGVAMTSPADGHMYVTSGGIWHKSGGVLRGPFNAPAITVADWTSSALAAGTTNLVGRLGSSNNAWLCAPGNGRVVNFVQLVAKLSGTMSAGDLTLTVMLNGVATGLVLNISSGGSSGVAVVALGAVLAGQLDAVTIRRVTSAAFAPAGTLFLDCSLHGVITG